MSKSEDKEGRHANDEPKFSTDVVIGLEIHIELDTNTKIFCRCPTKSQTEDLDEPNSRTCEICLGMPGSKPVFNKKVLEYGLRLCLALNCKPAQNLIFSRKSYFYPDMSKNYQISQYEIPLGSNGQVVLELTNGKGANGSNSGDVAAGSTKQVDTDGKKIIGITRVHLEEDPASLIHPEGLADSGSVLIEYNRSGNPLAEIVTEPDITSPAEARDFMKTLITLLDYLEIFDIKNGIIKADANISIKETGYKRVEIKNITGFKDIERALEYEVRRQKTAYAEGKQIFMETRSWDSQKGSTIVLRSKETEQDYGYIIDPDLVKIEISTDMISRAKEMLPELAQDKALRYERMGVERTDAKVISQSKGLVKIFEGLLHDSHDDDSGDVSDRSLGVVDKILAARWVRREVTRVLNYNKIEPDDADIDVAQLKVLLLMLQNKKITDTTAQKLLDELVVNSFDVAAKVESEGLGVVSDSGELKEFCKQAIAESGQAKDDYLAGNQKSLHFIVGLVMKKSKGKADPAKVRDILQEMMK